MLRCIAPACFDALTGHCDFPIAGIYNFRRHRLIQTGKADPHGPAERVTIAANLKVTDFVTLQIDQFRAVKQRFRILEQKLQHSIWRYAFGFDISQRVPTDETAFLVELYGKTQPRFDRVVGVIDINPEIAIGFFQSE